MKYTYTILLLILFSGMNCNNSVKDSPICSTGMNFDRFYAEKEKLTTALLELEYLNLKLERRSKHRILRIENPNMGSSQIFTNDTIQ